MKKVIATVLILIAILCVVIISEERPMPIDVPEETSFGYSLYDKNKKNGVQMDEFVQNPDYEYARLSYNAWYEWEGEGICLGDYFLTSSSEVREEYDSYFRRIESLPQLNNVKGWISRNASFHEEHWEYFELTVSFDSLPDEIDEEFFQNHHLYVVEFCFMGNPSLRSRLDEVSLHGSSVDITISYQTTHAWTADCPAEIYFIVIPADTKTVNVTLKEDAWLYEWDLEQ